jgi:hypothetical protein
MSMTPFEVRLEVLKMAKDLCMEKHYNQKQKVECTYFNSVDFNQKNDLAPPNFPDFPDVPTENEILSRAKNLIEFVNGK